MNDKSSRRLRVALHLLAVALGFAFGWRCALGMAAGILFCYIEDRL